MARSKFRSLRLTEPLLRTTQATVSRKGEDGCGGLRKGRPEILQIGCGTPVGQRTRLV